MKKPLFLLMFFLCALGVSAQKKAAANRQASKSEQLSSPAQYFKPVKWRNIGPSRGGRSVTASGVVNDPLVYYMGTTGGGLWKTEDAGQSWFNISDGYFTTSSVGAVAVSESDPKWCMWAWANTHHAA